MLCETGDVWFVVILELIEMSPEITTFVESHKSDRGYKIAFNSDSRAFYYRDVHSMLTIQLFNQGYRMNTICANSVNSEKNDLCEPRQILLKKVLLFTIVYLFPANIQTNQFIICPYLFEWNLRPSYLQGEFIFFYLNAIIYYYLYNGSDVALNKVQLIIPV